MFLYILKGTEDHPHFPSAEHRSRLDSSGSPLLRRIGDESGDAMSSKQKSTLQDSTFEVACPECGSTLKIDLATRAVIAHTPPPRKRTFEDFESAAKAMREQDERKESIFRQSVEAHKNNNDLLEKKFAEALRKAKENPDQGKPLREFDLD
jgi:hypothetical protein